MNNLTRTTSLIAIVLVTSVACGQSKDIITLKKRGGRNTVSGEIKSIDRDTVSIDVKGKTDQIPVDTISKIRFGDDPSGMSGARSSVASGQLEQAQKKVAAVKPGNVRSFVREDVAFHRAMINARLALKGQGSATDAAKGMNAFLKDPKLTPSFRYYDANELVGDLAMALGRFDMAAKYYARLNVSKSAATLARGSLLQGDAWLQHGDVAKATAMYSKAAQAAEATVKNLGLVGLASCMAKQGKASQSIPMLEKVIAENDSKDTELFARAYNALGRSYLASGNKSAALDAFLHTDLLFYRQTSQHAEALYHLSTLWAGAQKPAEAARARQTLKQRHGSSHWAKK